MTRPLRRDAQRNRELLVAAAREVFGEKGLDAPLEEIARRAGVAIGTLYNRFPTRMDLVEAAFGGLLDRLAGEAEQALKADDPWDGLVELIVRICELQTIDRGMTELCTSVLLDAPGLRAARERVGEVCEKVLARAHDAGVLRPDFGLDDLAFAIAATTRAAPLGDWRRHLTFLLDGIRPQDT
ncbi:TetR/AcrR family transcriptional regulator [Amycolatopsis thermoflava]|uniref:TetR/AcrR family transcriptional regulator n=1 Tax=Amycolatopsis thermoflava TaxID=84480 RepID=UPI00041C6112|nr:TetR/AcrR family transcriptional regulator [Amycolatopsis thermoflava]